MRIHTAANIVVIDPSVISLSGYNWAMMAEEKTLIRKIAIVGAQNLPDTEKESVAIASFLNKRGIETQHGFLYDEAIYRRVKQGEFDI